MFWSANFFTLSNQIRSDTNTSLTSTPLTSTPRALKRSMRFINSRRVLERVSLGRPGRSSSRASNQVAEHDNTTYPSQTNVRRTKAIVISYLRAPAVPFLTPRRMYAFADHLRATITIDGSFRHILMMSTTERKSFS